MSTAYRRYRPSLVVYVAWHGGRANARAEALATGLRAYLDRDPAVLLSRGVGIPVFFRTSAAGVPLPPVCFDEADQTLGVLLIDDGFILDESCVAFAQSVARCASQSAGRYCVIPVQLGDNSLHLGTVNSCRLREPVIERGRILNRVVAHELCRRLLGHSRARAEAGSAPISAAPVQLFLSHAKRDHGKDLVALFRNRLAADPRLEIETFFDAKDIPAGSDFAQEIEGQIERSALIAFQTDYYSSRPWCRREVLIAKRNGVPVVVVNAVEQAEERTFPYLGNTPSIRWALHGPDRSEDVLDLTLREVLRSSYTRFHLASLRDAGWIPQDAELRPRLPEVITCLDASPQTAAPRAGAPLVVYPDPPLGHEEVELLAQANPRARLATPTALAVPRRPDGKLPFEGRKIAVSISESADLGRLGMDESHLHAIYIDVARHLLAAGATLLYGGDLRCGGFTDALIDLVLEHRRSSRELDGSIVSYLAWPEVHNVTQGREASLKPEMAFRRCDEATGLSVVEREALCRRLERLRADGLPMTSAAAPDRTALMANLTSMREQMTHDTDARLVLGGRVTGFVGTVPGVAEEAFLAIREARPLFVAGGFGGCAGAVAHALRGASAPGFRSAAQDDSAKLLLEHCNATGAPAMGPDRVESFLRACGERNLRNGLEPEENQALFDTAHGAELISLVMTGLTRLWH